jgi:hypothetical protein
MDGAGRVRRFSRPPVEYFVWLRVRTWRIKARRRLRCSSLSEAFDVMGFLPAGDGSYEISFQSARAIQMAAETANSAIRPAVSQSREIIVMVARVQTH